ncbi:MAG: hypothetical protein CVT90_00430, partial [Candidatus Altiarchaeales archaeon HGW-Altiarchaeales-3]
MGKPLKMAKTTKNTGKNKNNKNEDRSSIYIYIYTKIGVLSLVGVIMLMLVSVSVSAGISSDIRYLSTSPEPVSPGGTLSVSYQVLGTGGSYPYETQTIYIDGVQKACYHDNIADGSWSSKTRYVTAPTSSGSHTVKVKVYGCGSSTGCCGLADKEASKSFTVKSSSKPDLVITDIWKSGSTVYYTIKNQGGTTAGYTYSKLYIDGV